MGDVVLFGGGGGEKKMISTVGTGVLVYLSHFAPCRVMLICWTPFS